MLNHAKRAQEFLALPAPTPASEAPTPYAPEPLAVRSATPFWTNGKKLSLSELFDKTVFILGLGNIGKEVARRCSAGFGMRVWGAKRTAEPVDNVDRVFNSDDWKFPEVLGEVDYFVIAAPASESTTEILNSETLGRLKKGAYIVNVGCVASSSTN